MAWTYTDPSASPKDEVRFLMGDTDQDLPHMSDEEIAYLLGKYDVETAAAQACEQLAAKYAGRIDRTVGSLTINYSQMTQQFADTAARLRKQSRSPEAVAAGGAGPLVFGIAHAEKDSKDADDSLVPDTFDEGFMDHPGTFTDSRLG
ncbi:MAG: hypothetical protein MUF33_00455 [Candidatus Nanopelagicales bacterium]|nr:hypothetical protein [Candidatus Nanopelagicales bacterium]MCU0296970.1 hypothetical protein [Candidatus Nanopelagicales bacterium]